MKHYKTLQETMQKSSGIASIVISPKSNFSLRDIFSFVHQEFEGLSGCLPLLRRGCSGGGQWWPVREKLF